jgi:hypothetical protein
MRGVKDFLKDSLPGMIDYILVISTPVPDPYGAYPGPYGPYTGPSEDRRNRLNIVDALQQRGATMPVLFREAVPLLPHLLDVPRHLAVVASAVIRASKGKQQRRKPSQPIDAQLDAFIARCFEVEETALHRVSQLASRAPENPPASPTAHRLSTSSTVTARFRQPSISSVPRSPPSNHRPLNSQKSSRSATVPSQSDLSDTPQGPEMQSDASFPVSPVSNIVLPPPSRLLTRASQTDLSSGQPSSPEDTSWSRRRSRLKAKSTSTDSIPSYTAQSPADSSPVAAKTIESQTESDDQIRKKKGILRGILTRR